MRHPEDGFTAVELLVTLFVAVAFIATAYQLYTAVVKDSGEARFRAKASNIAYAELRKRADDTTPGCTAVTNQGFTMPADHGLDQPAGTITIQCRTDGLTYIRSVVTYGPAGNKQEVQHAIFAAK